MIGSQIARAVLEDPDQVFAPDSEVIVLARWRSSMKNLRGMLFIESGSQSGKNAKFRHRGIRIVYGDVSDAFAMLELILEQERPTHIFHFAAQAINGVSWPAASLSLSVNTQGTLNVLEAVRRLDAERAGAGEGKEGSTFRRKTKVLVAGSSAEYGFTALDYDETRPIPEDVPLKPMTPYGVSKVAQENLASVYAHNYGVEACTARIFIHMAPGGTEHLSVQNFAKQIAEAEQVWEREYKFEVTTRAATRLNSASVEKSKAASVSKKKDVSTDPRLELRHGDLSTFRDVTDVRGSRYVYPTLLLRCLPGEAYNVGSSQTFSISGMLDILLNATQAPIRRVLDESRLRKADERVLLANITKLQELTGWDPKPDIWRTAVDLLDFWRSEVKDREG